MLERVRSWQFDYSLLLLRVEFLKQLVELALSRRVGSHWPLLRKHDTLGRRAIVVSICYVVLVEKGRLRSFDLLGLHELTVDGRDECTRSYFNRPVCVRKHKLRCLYVSRIVESRQGFGFRNILGYPLRAACFRNHHWLRECFLGMGRVLDVTSNTLSLHDCVDVLVDLFGQSILDSLIKAVLLTELACQIIAPVFVTLLNNDIF